MLRLVLALACCLEGTAFAAPFRAIVSHVTDGDSVWVRPADGGPALQVRIEGIDAPEVCQAFGADARQALAAKVLRRPVVVVPDGQDDYRRTVARLRIGREDVGGWMVSRGYAWSYRFRKDPGPYVRQEARARNAKLGLWGGEAPESPRSFRLRHGPCH